jgi:hypothetical protein
MMTRGKTLAGRQLTAALAASPATASAAPSLVDHLGADELTVVLHVLTPRVVLQVRAVCTFLRSLVAAAETWQGAQRFRSDYERHRFTKDGLGKWNHFQLSLDRDVSQQTCKRAELLGPAWLQVFVKPRVGAVRARFNLPLLKRCLSNMVNITSLILSWYKPLTTAATRGLFDALRLTPHLEELRLFLHDEEGWSVEGGPAHFSKEMLGELAAALPRLQFAGMGDVPLVWWAPFKSLLSVDIRSQSIKGADVAAVLSSSTALESITVCNCWWDDDMHELSASRAVATNLRRLLLAEVELPPDRMAPLLAAAPNLTELCITFAENLTDTSLQYIACRFTPTLKILTLHDDLQSVTPAAVAAITVACQSLTFLRIYWIDPDFAWQEFKPGDPTYDMVIASLTARGGTMVYSHCDAVE